MTTLGEIAGALEGRYTVERELGHGGMAIVYLAHDVKHDRRVAIKVLRPELAAALGAERFLREITIAAQLHHPHILPLYDSGEAGGFLFYVMPYVEGESLRDRLERETQLPLVDALQITREVADALSYAHNQDVVHRDIKPENILLESGHAIVADFGIARAITAAGGETLTGTGIAVGTPSYMSPEQASGDHRLDGRSDLYSLGCVTYEMLAGTPPYVGPTPQAILARRLTDPIPPLKTVRETVPESIERAIARALAKVPADRFATVMQFAEALEKPVLARSRLSWWLALGTASLAVVGIGVAKLIGRHRPVVIPSASVIAVIPFAPSVPDTALSRLGRDLVLTISASLDGIGDIHTVDPGTVLVQSEDPTARYSRDQATGLGRRFGAGSVIHGSLVRDGRNVRLDFELLGIAGEPSLARVTVVGSPDSTAALTDSATWQLLHQIWLRGEPPTPSLAAVTTQSVPALRAFLEGERAMTDGLWPDAEKAFARAIGADSSFWLAYWRHMYARNFQGQPEDKALYQALWLHRTQVHGVDSLLLEADGGPGSSKTSVALTLSEKATRDYPYNWWAWFFHADYLVHQGPRLGYGIRDARAALERTLALNPRHAEGWAHLLMVTVGQDSSASSRAFERFRRVSHDRGLVRWARLYYELDRNGGVVDSALADSVEDDVGGPTLMAPEISVRFLEHGFPAAQIAYDRRVLRRGVSLLAAPLFRLSVGRSWAARGAWDSALVAADDYAAKAEQDSAALEGYRLAVVGALFGALDLDLAQQRRRVIAPVAERMSPVARAELAWLDGMLAVTLRDQQGLAKARALLRRSGDSARPVLDRSLAAFGLELAGERRRAADSLAAIEWQRPDFIRAIHGWVGIGVHPFLTGVNRMAAASWLLQEGDTALAARLLTWHETRVWSGEAHAADAVLAGLSYLQLARIEEARGRPDLAMFYYRQFLKRYDRPVPAQRKLVEEARAALARLEGRVVGEGRRGP